MMDTKGLDDNEFHKLKLTIKKIMPFEASKYSDSFLKRRIYGRMNVTKITTYQDYESFVLQNKKEQEELQKNLTIHVTDFFRDESFWKFCKEKLIPEIMNRKEKERYIKIWSAGCSSGQEPISIMISFLETNQSNKSKLKVIGTDIETDVLEKAKRFEYDQNDIRGLTSDIKNKYFNTRDDKIVLKEEYKQFIEYRKHDLLVDEPIKDVAAIFCRNTVIYFSISAKEELYMKLYSLLKPGDFLILGKTEILLAPANKNFKIYDSRERVYEK